MSHLRVYDTEAPDGLAGGTPHCHTACTEACAVIAGRGRVLTLAGDGFRSTPIEAGSFVWFTPGTIHRLVNESGDLEILVIMANAGLPEAGDMVLTLRAACSTTTTPTDRRRCSASSATTEADDRAARARRDLAVEGLDELLHAGPDGLERFHRRAAELVRPSVEGWRARWEARPPRRRRADGRTLAALARGDIAHLGESSVHALPPPPDARRYGCCGTLGVVQPAEPDLG
ncbi:MAG: cupin domain-containing protein [Acidimicrobiales bacterium]